MRVAHLALVLLALVLVLVARVCPLFGLVSLVARARALRPFVRGSMDHLVANMDRGPAMWPTSGGAHGSGQRQDER
ncbi:MAG: hypothetical protein WAN93_12065 [Solirubrobacteraceae bacterium]